MLHLYCLLAFIYTRPYAALWAAGQGCCVVKITIIVHWRSISLTLVCLSALDRAGLFRGRMFASKPLLLFKLRRRTPASVLTFSKERSSLVWCLIWRGLPSCSCRWRSSPLEWLTWAVRWTGAPWWSLVPIPGGHVPVQPPSPGILGQLHLGTPWGRTLGLPSWGRKRSHPQWWWKSLRLISLFVFQYYLFAKSDLDFSIDFFFVFVLYLSNYSFAKYYVLSNHNNFGRGGGAGQE